MSGRSLAKRTFKHVQRKNKTYNWHEYKSVAMPAMYKEYPAKTHAEHRKRVISLYRDVMYSAPRIYEMYEAEAFASQKQFRKMIKAKFDQHKDVTDLNELDMILHLGKLEYNDMYCMFLTKFPGKAALLPPRPTVAPKALEGTEEQTPFLKDFYGFQQPGYALEK